MANALPACLDPAAPADAVSVTARPVFHRWLFERRKTNAAAARELGVSREAIRLICLDFDDPARMPPSEELRRRIEAWTEGAAPGWSFDDTPQARAAFFTPPPVPGESPP